MVRLISLTTFPVQKNYSHLPSSQCLRKNVQMFLILQGTSCCWRWFYLQPGDWHVHVLLHLLCLPLPHRVRLCQRHDGGYKVIWWSSLWWFAISSHPLPLQLSINSNSVSTELVWLLLRISAVQKIICLVTLTCCQTWGNYHNAQINIFAAGKYC